jgi:putative inorganic carbon (hco3(-)) transporter
MRAILVFSLIFLIIPLSFFAPFIGLNAYVWLAYLRLHEWAYMPGARFSLYLAVATLVGYLLFELTKYPPKIWKNWLMVLLFAQLTLSTVLAYSPQDAHPKLFEFGKTIVIALLITTLVNSEQRVRRFYLGMIIAVGLLTVRSTLNVLITGGVDRAYGPGGMFEDNNDYALLLVTAMPIMFYGARGEKKPLLRYLCYGFASMTFVTVFFTRSRGGFVALCLMLIVLASKSKYIVTGFAGAAVALLLMLALVPLVVVERIGTIRDARTIDESAQQRLKMWRISMNMIADHPMTGIGPRNMPQVYFRYSEEVNPRVSHNSFLQMGVDAGIPGIGIFTAIILVSYWRLGRARKLLRALAPDSPIINYTHGLQVGLAGYTAGAMFASRHDFEMVYHIAALAASFLLIAEKHASEAEAREVVAAASQPFSAAPAAAGN